MYPWQQTFGPCTVLIVAQHFFVTDTVWFIILQILFTVIYLEIFPFWNTSENRSEPNPPQCSYSLWSLLNSCSRLFMLGAVAITPTGSVGGFVGDNSILSYTTGSSYQKRVYRHPDCSLSPPALSCIQQRNSQELLLVTVTTPPFQHRKCRAGFFPFTAWRFLCFVKDPTHNRQTHLSFYPLSLCLLASTQIGKHSKARLCSAAAASPAQRCRPPPQRHGSGRDAEAWFPEYNYPPRLVCTKQPLFLNFFSTDATTLVNAQQGLTLSNDLSMTSLGIKGLTEHLQCKKCRQTVWQE